MTGGGEQSSKEARQQEDFASSAEQRNNIKNQFLSQLVPGSSEYNELQAILIGPGSGPNHGEINALGQQLVARQQARIASGEPATALEARTNISVQGLRQAAAFTPDEQAVLKALRGEAPTDDLGRIFSEVLSRAGTDGTGLAQELERALRGEATTTPLGAQAGRMVAIAGEDPDLAFTQELDLLQDRINREANARGLATSGIPIEQLGRAGVELAVRKASERENIRRTREADVLDLLTRAQQGDQEALANVQALFTTGQTLRGREIGLEEAVTNLQAGRESNLTALLQGQTGNATENLLRLLQRSTEQSTADRLDALDQEAARRAARGGAVGTGLAVAAAPFTGGASLALIPAAQSIGSAVAGGGASTRQRPAGADVASLIASQQTPSTSGAQPPLGSTLNRRRNDDDDEFAAFVRSLQASGGDFATGLRAGGF